MKATTLLSKVWSRSKTAIPIWLLLEQQARLKGRKRFSIKRRTLGRLLGISRLPTLSEAISVLHELGIIRRKVRRCRRPDGTVFHRLTIHIKLNLAEATKELHQVRKTRYEPGTAPDNEKRNHSPGTVHSPDNEKRYTSLRDGGTRGIQPPRRTHASANAAGQDRSADATLPAQTVEACLKYPMDWPKMEKEMHVLIEMACKQIGCMPEEFNAEDSDYAYLCDETTEPSTTLAISKLNPLEPAGIVWMTSDPTDNDKYIEHEWTGTPEQVAIFKEILERREKTTWAWHKLSLATRHSARQLCRHTEAKIADFTHDPGKVGVLYLSNTKGFDSAWFYIDAHGDAWLIRHPEAKVEIWHRTEEQVNFFNQRLALQRKANDNSST